MPASLFADFEDVPPQASRLRPLLRALADKGVFLGTSSWKYEGWLGSIFQPDRYLTRGKLSRKKFEAECLAEYAETFPVVGGDFSFYQFPSADYWQRLFTGLPRRFGFGLKVPEEITVVRWPGHARYGTWAGAANEHFLDAELFSNAFLAPLEPYRDHVPVIMFEFGAIAKKEIAEPGIFLDRLDAFLTRLPGGWNFAVEIRNADYLGPDYLALLARHRVAHVLNAWTRMPTIAEQLRHPGIFSTDFTVVRALLQKGCTYEQAVKAYEPYREIQAPDTATRKAIVDLSEDCLRAGRRVYAFINNRLEGNAPGTIEHIAGSLLAGLSSSAIAR